ncbi:MAG: glycosyltransferase family 2 protein [Verrucomicrobiae bacterium]|nr:glycosyltransferase family 2 protein [Verrucomicrobiae bacterium]
MAPEVSILLACFNGVANLAASLRSVQEQTFSGWELICVDDGSTDGSAGFMESLAQDQPRLVVLRNERNLGLTCSLNRAASVARGRYIARLDVGDAFMPEKLAKQVAYLDDHPEVILCGTQVVFTSQGREVGRSHFACQDQDIRRRFVTRQGVFCHSSIMFRNRGVFYNEAFRYSQDLELYMRMACLGKLACLDECLTVYRFDEQGLTLGRKYFQRQYANAAYELYRRGFFSPGRPPPELPWKIHDRFLGRFLCRLSMRCFRRYVENRPTAVIPWLWLGLSCMIYPPLLFDYVQKAMGWARVRFFEGGKVQRFRVQRLEK